MDSRLFTLLIALCTILFSLASAARAAGPVTVDTEFFEAKVRPLLVTHCYECHSSESDEPRGGLLLDRRPGLIRGGDSGPAIVPGNPDESLLIAAVRYQSVEMPPDGKLDDAEIAALEHWIESGAAWPAQAAIPDSRPSEKTDWSALQAGHWAYRPIDSPPLPKVIDAAWCATEIDRFVLSRLERQGLSPAPRADDRGLVRRVYFDLTGLPPSVAEMQRYELDQRPDAYARLVDELLSSPRYGERWGRYWLDLARYSDGLGGFNDRAAMPHAYHYRDWVVKQLNLDLPYDQFVLQQVAGDQMSVPDGALGTGFFATGPTYNSDGGDPDSVAQAKSETLDDRVDTMTRTFLGLTVACARCHDHKFDPIPTLDYYSLAGVFNNTQVVETPLVPAEVVAKYDAAQQVFRELDQKIKQLQKTAKREQRALTDDEQRQRESLTRLRDQAKAAVPTKYPVAYALQDNGQDDMPVALRGNLRKPGQIAPRRFLRIVEGESPSSFSTGSGRLELGASLTAPNNPLLARVMVNRLWQHHIGRAIVRTPSNFGSLGEAPTHPRLLDWMAHNFVQQGWSMKWLHRKILMSATYCMSSKFDRKAFAVDGENRWIWRMNPRRLDVEAWRDSLLFVTGALDVTMGGPAEELFSSHRRTLYSKVSRSGDTFDSDELLRLFDFPVPRGSQPKRVTSTVPQQFLFMLNSTFMIERAKALALRLEHEAEGDEQRIESAYQTLYNRRPTDQEIKLGLLFLRQQPNEKLTPWQQYAQVLLSANELMHWE